jgi:hypothetical protein
MILGSGGQCNRQRHVFLGFHNLEEFFEITVVGQDAEIQPCDKGGGAGGDVEARRLRRAARGDRDPHRHGPRWANPPPERWSPQNVCSGPVRASRAGVTNEASFGFSCVSPCFSLRLQRLTAPLPTLSSNVDAASSPRFATCAHSPALQRGAPQGGFAPEPPLRRAPSFALRRLYCFVIIVISNYCNLYLFGPASFLDLTEF